MGLALGPIGIAASVIGTGLSALGAMNQAKATAANAQYQAEVARNNQVIASQNAAYASQAGAAKTQQVQMEQRAQAGAIGASLAASGLDINSGSAADTRKAENEIGQLNTATTAQNSALQVYGYRTQASGYGGQATLFQNEASQASSSAPLALGATLLSGVGGLASKWNAWQLATGAPANSNIAGVGDVAGTAGSGLVTY